MSTQVLPSAAAAGSNGSNLSAGVTTSVAANLASFFLPTPGTYICYSVGANCKFQVFDNDGGGTWHDLTAVGVLPGQGAPIFCDGTNFRFANTHATLAQNVILQKVG